MDDPRRRARAGIATAIWLGAVIGGGCALGFRNPDGAAATAGGAGIARLADGPAPPTEGDERLRAALNDARPYRWSEPRNDTRRFTTKTDDGERE